MPTTLIPFTKRVLAKARTEGVPYLKSTDVADLTALINEQLNVYASRTQCLQAEGVAFTPVVGQRVYDISQTSQVINSVNTTYLGAAMCNIAQVMLNGVYLLICEDDQGRPGPSSRFRVEQNSPQYLLQGNGLPRFWWQSPPNLLYFDRPFDQVYANCFVDGRRYHTPLTGLDQAIDFADEDLADASDLCAAELLGPYSRAKAEEMKAILKKKMEARCGECGIKKNPSGYRQTNEPRQIVNLGR